MSYFQAKSPLNVVLREEPMVTCTVLSQSDLMLFTKVTLHKDQKIPIPYRIYESLTGTELAKSPVIQNVSLVNESSWDFWGMGVS